MAVKYTPTQAAKAYLSCRDTMLTYENEDIESAKDGIPCSSKSKENSKSLFLLFAIENIDHLSSDSDKDILIDKVMRAGRLTPNSVSDQSASAFLLTDKGVRISNAIS